MDHTFPITVTLNSPVTIKAGFTVSPFPSGKILLNVSHPLSSYATGFDTKVKFLPFDVNAPNLSFNISVAYRPMLSINVGLVTGSSADALASISGGVGVYVDLPKLTAEVTQVHNVNDKCQPDSSKQNSEYIQVQPSINFDTGAFFSLSGHVGTKNVPSVPNGPKKQMNSTTHALGEQCLRWDAGKSSLILVSDTTDSLSNVLTLSTGAKAGVGIGAGVGLILILVAGYFLVTCLKGSYGKEADHNSKAGHGGLRGFLRKKTSESYMYKQGPQMSTRDIGAFASPQSTHIPTVNERLLYPGSHGEEQHWGNSQYNTQYPYGSAQQPVSQQQYQPPQHNTQYQYNNQHANDPYQMDAYQAQYASDPRYTTASPAPLSQDVRPPEPNYVGAGSTTTISPSITPIHRKPTAAQTRTQSDRNIPTGGPGGPGRAGLSQNPPSPTPLAQPHPPLSHYKSYPPFAPSGVASPYPNDQISFAGGGWAGARPGPENTSGTIYTQPPAGTTVGQGMDVQRSYHDSVTQPQLQPDGMWGTDGRGGGQGVTGQTYQGSGLVRFKKVRLGQ